MTIERRAKLRFPLTATVRYKQLDGARVLAEGTAQTVNVSSDGILLRCDQWLRRARKVQLVLHWPLIDGTAPLAVHADGHVVWVKDDCVAIQWRHQEFHTRKAAAA